MKERFKPNLNLYTNGNNRRDGGIISRTMSSHKKTTHPADLDKENRQNIIKRIKEHLDEGGDLDIILDNLCEDKEINEQFGYLKRNGLNLRDLFKSWYESYEKASKRKQNWYTTGGIINKEKSDENEIR